MSRVLEITKQVLAEIGEERNCSELMNVTDDTRVFGTQGCLDSIGVVHLVSELEAVIFEEFGVDVLLADDRAMSYRTSPFRSVKTLYAHIEDCLSTGAGR
ncbi:hypothetical protein [Kordiimonas sp.]|uniref:hypothetical protein n=1 Tax=Kordiimonas sp. TaxID=1970157 RepID=UPI003A91C697